MSPVVFEDDNLTSGVTWDGLHLEGDNSALAYVEVSGASEGLDVRATGVTLDHVTLSGNATGLRTDYISSGCSVGCLPPERAEVIVSNSKISGNSSIGVYARNADLSLTSTTIEHNANYGVYATNATLDPVQDVRLTDTGYDPADGSPIPLALGRGVYLSASGELHLSDAQFISSPNRIAGNAGDEVWAASGSYLFVGNQFTGTNAIFDASGGRLITNYDGNVVMAEQVYWGDKNGPPAGAFYDGRLVDADPFEKSDPSGGAGAPFRQAPGEGAAPESTVLAAASWDEGLAPTAAGRGEGEWVAWLRTQLRQLRRDFRDNPGDEQALTRLRRLVYLQRLDRDDAAGERSATRAALRLIRRHLENGGSLPPRLRRVAERALRAEIESALATEEYAWADSLYGAYAAHVATPRERLPLLLAGASLDEHRGDYAGAIAKVSEVIAAAEGAGTEEATALVEVLEGELATLEALLAEAGDGARGTAPTAGMGDAASRTGSGLPAEYALEAAYPNPFSGTTTLPLALPEAVDVRVAVYDVLGREVAVLADGPMEAGRHALSLDGSHLASGVYVARAVCEGEGATRVLTSRLTLVR